MFEPEVFWKQMYCIEESRLLVTLLGLFDTPAVMRRPGNCYPPSMAILRGAWVGHAPPRFLLGPLFGPRSFFRYFPFKFVWLTYAVDNFWPAIF